jgi:hypothetical protein
MRAAKTTAKRSATKGRSRPRSTRTARSRSS